MREVNLKLVKGLGRPLNGLRVLGAILKLVKVARGNNDDVAKVYGKQR